MSQLIKRVTINAPVNQVWGVLADFGNVARWTPTVEESHCTTDKEKGVGAERIIKTGELGLQPRFMLVVSTLCSIAGCLY